MPRCFIAPHQRQTAAKRLVLCFGCVCLSFIAIVRFGLLPRLQAAQNILPHRQVSTAPAKSPPELVASYGKLPLVIGANQGPVSGPAKSLLRCGGDAMFLVSDDAVVEDFIHDENCRDIRHSNKNSYIPATTSVTLKRGQENLAAIGMPAMSHAGAATPF